MADDTKRLDARAEILEIGGRAIYDFRSHPRKAPWDKAAAETRASYRARMQELLNALAKENYGISYGAHAGKPFSATSRGSR